MQEIGKFNENIDLIPKYMERYLAFMVGKQLKFIDSFQFMSSSLAQLVDNLPRTDFKHTSEFFSDRNLVNHMVRNHITRLCIRTIL